MKKGFSSFHPSWDAFIFQVAVCDNSFCFVFVFVPFFNDGCIVWRIKERGVLGEI